MKITNNSYTQLNIPKDINNDVSKKENDSNSISTKDSFVKQSDEKKPSFLDKVKSKLFENIKQPMLSLYPKMTDEKKATILNLLQPGDLILDTDTNYPISAIAEKIIGDSDFSHVSIYEGDGKRIEANTNINGKDCVARTELSDSLYGRRVIKIIRPDYKSQEDVKAALDYARDQIGKPYDSAFDYSSDDSQYCSELVAKALKAMPNAINVNTFKILNREAVLPGDFQDLKDSKVIYDEGFNFVKGQLHMMPAFAGGLALGVGFGLLLGPVGACMGFLTGTMATTCFGGRIQESMIGHKK